ncbi:hypothetical protein G2W53_023011 [Senna tora]|uniref:Neprosin PEP catalytic domain-containing protein n=1 Tax=Senna tora TaxID=362788 RepID=A0A834TNQ6_9FABA|nr:hypothetical protein G2W53_023011 [Senna tora]
MSPACFRLFQLHVLVVLNFSCIFYIEVETLAGFPNAKLFFSIPWRCHIKTAMPWTSSMGFSWKSAPPFYLGTMAAMSDNTDYGFINKAKTREININGISEEEDLELERQLKILNKHPVQTFQLKEGVTIDCIKINEQPSLDHPLLKNHKIQMQPNSFPKGVQVNNSAIEGILRSFKRTCPIGTIPIQRSTKQDLIRAKSFWKLQIMSKSNNASTPNTFYPDHKNDAYKTGCYNLLCQGFVQIDRTMFPGSRVISEIAYGSKNIVDFIIYQDGLNGNWWLIIGVKPITKINVGYWPSELFPFMRNGSNHVGWGGSTRAGRNGLWAPMGDGVMPDGDYTHSAFFNKIHFVDDSLAFQVPQDNQTVDIVESPKCYGLVKTKKEEAQGGYILTFGGPGGYSC